MNKNNSSENKNKGSAFGRFFGRFFFGAGHKIADEIEERAKDADSIEEIISPGKQILINFFERKLAVGALIVVMIMFLIVYIGPLVMHNYSDSYTSVTQKNVPPGRNMMSVPRELASDVKMIDSYGTFSVGLSNSGKVYVWGQTKIGITGQDASNIPEEVKNAKIAMVTAGIDHIVAIGEDGKIYGWGNSRQGQFGVSEDFESNPNIQMMPRELHEKGIDVSKIKKLESGFQCTAILMNDGTLHIWGNRHAYANIDNFSVEGLKFKDIGFTLNYVVGVPEAGNMVYTGSRGLFGMFAANLGETPEKPAAFLKGRTIESIKATSSNVCLHLSDNSICFAGDYPAGTVSAPSLPEGEHFVTIDSGTGHYTGLTNLGNVYSFGDNTWNQSKVPNKADGASKIFACSMQSYSVNESGKLLAKWGLKGYFFGTDTYGADVFSRIIAGGMMTMTIGAVAVIISSIIGIIIGCLSGYFGGKTDIILMRVLEIFSAIPFLPFALTLSAAMTQLTISSTMRIFIIMFILGILSWPGIARLVRGQVLLTRESEYVVAAQAMGVKSSKIAFKHILPNIISVILVTLTLDFATCMLIESTLSYLGFGVPYPKPSWGNMLYGSNNSTIIKNFWWQWAFPAIALGISTICINIVGDNLRDVMDPKASIEK
ncbi:MAG: ABC transporter permease subunit [Ruminococcaceae bacterium]|nr:ABC transporter permease subunit [Oscillospiraceae bacterium]